MTEQLQTTSQTSETQVRNLTADELEHVNGGSGGYFVWVDGSVRSVDAADYTLWRANYGRTI